MSAHSPVPAAPTHDGVIPADHVVLVDDDRRITGVAPRATVHTAETPLHLAFSCYVFDSAGRVLLTRRALAKRTWPGVWTNAFCGHPRLEEPMESAVVRHGRHELGLVVNRVACVLPDFRYTATDASGVVENEICPVYVAVAATDPKPNPDEVMDLVWVEPETLGRLVVATPWAVSPWMVEQVRELADVDLEGLAPVSGLAT